MWSLDRGDAIVLTVVLRIFALVSRHIPLLIASIILTTLYLHATHALRKDKEEQQRIVDGQSMILEAAKQVEGQAQERWKSVATYGSDALDRELRKLAIEIRDRQSEISDIGFTISPDMLVKKAKLQLQVEALKQEVSYLTAVRAVAFAREQLERHGTSCKRLNDDVQTKYKEAMRLADEMSRWGPLEKVSSTANPISDEFQLRQRRERLEAAVVRDGQEVVRCVRSYKQTKAKLDRNPSNGPITFSAGWAEPAVADLTKRERELKAEIDSHWLQKGKVAIQAEVKGPYLREAIVLVVKCLAGAALLWLLVKLLFYRCLAPRASHAEPIRLVPEAEGKADIASRDPGSSANRDGGSPVLLNIKVGTGSVVALRPEFFHSATEQCDVSAGAVANRECLSASVLANLWNLTEIRSKSEGLVTVSTGGLPLQEVAIVDIPTRSAVCVLPAHIVGLLYNDQARPSISKHLRLFNLQAWLTLRFRYLVFHGPVRLIMMGCRGLLLQPVNQERSVPHAHMVGFSANLEYRVTQTETFWAYVTKKKQLIRDRFTGGPGVLIVERVPSGWKRRGVREKGLDGAVETTIDVLTSASGRM